MVIVFGSSFLIGVFLFFAVALGYQLYLAVRGAAFVVAVLVMLGHTIAAVAVLVSKIREHRAAPKDTTVGDVLLSFVAAAVSLAAAYLFARDLPSYGDGLMDMICYVVGALFCGTAWLLTLGGFISATAEKGFRYKYFLLELLAFAPLLALYLI